MIVKTQTHKNKQSGQPLLAIPSLPSKHFQYFSKRQLKVQEYQKCY